MKITRVIDGREIQIELTPEEIREIQAEDRGREGGIYFGIVRWCDEDLEQTLKSHGYQVSEESVGGLRVKLEHHSFTDHMISAGWDFIETCVSDMEQELVKQPWKYKCTVCGEVFTFDSQEDFGDYGEETLWGHIQNDHPEAFKECQNWETPIMLEYLYYDVSELPEDIDPGDYTIEYCPFCDAEQVIFAKGITACPECGKPLAPCSLCEDCNYETCPYGCTGGEKDEFKEITNPPIPAELAEKLYKVL